MTEDFLLTCIWQDEDAYFRDYAVSHKKLSELGFITPPPKVSRTLARVLWHAITVAVVILSLFFAFSKRRQNLACLILFKTCPNIV